MRIESLGAVAVLLFVTGCGSQLAQPFEGMKAANAPVTVYRLQNFEPPQPTQATPGQAAGSVLPPQVQQWATAAAQMLPPGLIPQGLIPGSAPPPPPDANVPKFHDFRILGWVPLQDKLSHDDLLTVMGTDTSFTTPKEACMYAEFGVSIQQPNNQPPADVLVSLSCNQVRTFNFAWPYGNTNGLTGDSSKKIVEIMKKAFGG